MEPPSGCGRCAAHVPGRGIWRAEKKTVLLELGVGYNTPTIIRFPFERMTYENEGVFLIRMNADYPEAIEENEKKTVSFGEDMAEVLPALAEK